MAARGDRPAGVRPALRPTPEVGAQHAAPLQMRHGRLRPLALLYFRAQLRLRLLLLLSALLLVCVATASAQVSREYQLRAVLLLRLTQFTQWPAETFQNESSPVAVCVLGDNPFSDALNAALAGETAHGRPLISQHHRSIETIKTCHVLYMTGVGPRQAKTLSSALAGRSILTVRDADSVASSYDTVVVFDSEQGRVKLRISAKAAAAARLVLDPRLLRVAEIVE